ncbi:facilitated trehalose transporter Tret1-like [Amblyomma americanum]
MTVLGADTEASALWRPMWGKGRPRALSLAQYRTLTAAWLGGLCMGTALGYAPSALRTLTRNAANEKGLSPPLLEEQVFWFSRILSPGAVLGSLCGGSLCQWLGRRQGLLGCSVSFLVSWLLLQSARSSLWLHAGHLAVGFSAGLVSLCAPVYVVEVAATESRGLLGGCLYVSVAAGVLLCRCLGELLDWSWLAAACAMPALLLGAAAFHTVESPRWLLAHARRSSAVQALRLLRWRGTSEDREAHRTEEAFIWVPPSAVNVLLAYHIMFVQQLTGIAAAPSYIEGLAQAIGVPLSTSKFAIVLASLQLLSSAASAATMDTLGRRRLFLASSCVCVCTLFAVGAVGMSSHSREAHWVVRGLELVLLVAYLVGHSFGLGPVSWLLAAEMIPLRGCGFLLSLAFAFNWLSSFAVALFFGAIREKLPFAAAGWFFSAVTMAGASLFYWFAPETNGRSMEQLLLEITADGEEYRSVISRQQSLFMKH